MDLLTILFVLMLLVVALLVTVTIRRDIKGKENLSRELQREVQHPHLRPTDAGLPRARQRQIKLPDEEDKPDSQLTE